MKPSENFCSYTYLEDLQQQILQENIHVKPLHLHRINIFIVQESMHIHIQKYGGSEGSNERMIMKCMLMAFCCTHLGGGS